MTSIVICWLRSKQCLVNTWCVDVWEYKWLFLCGCLNMLGGRRWYHQDYSTDFGSTFKSPQFPASGEVGWICAENLLNAAIRESEKLNVKVDPTPPNPMMTTIPPPDEHCNHGQWGQPGWFSQNGRSLSRICWHCYEESEMYWRKEKMPSQMEVAP